MRASAAIGSEGRISVMTAPVKPSSRTPAAIPGTNQDRSLLRASGLAAKTIAPQAAALANWQRDFAKTIAPQAAALASWQRDFAKTIAPQAAALASWQRDFAKTIAPQAAALASWQRDFAKTIAPQAAALASWQRDFAKTIAPQAAALANWQRDFGQRSVVDSPRLVLRWIETFDRLTPSNLRKLSFQELDVVASLAFYEGLPLSWVPRDEIVAALIAADSPQARHRILRERRDDILDDCEHALATSKHEWALQCRSAIAAFRHGLFGPAQSHASNIVDSIVQTFSGARPRTLAVRNARRDFAEISFQQMAHYLTVRPLDRAFMQWSPNSGDPIPTHFARHPTAHAVGHATLFGSLNALVAVMLATSLTVQFGPREPMAITASRARLDQSQH